MQELTKEEKAIFQKLNMPRKIQDFLESLPINFEENGDSCLSPRRLLRERKAHCFEGALFAAAAMAFHEQPPLLLDLVGTDEDYDHVVALFQVDGHWGAFSKTNHAVLRYREPVYKTVRELAMSYFHEYFLDDGRKTLRAFSQPFDLRPYDSRDWLTTEEDPWYLMEELDASPHEKILNRGMITRLRPADPTEREAGKITQWQRKKK